MDNGSFCDCGKEFIRSKLCKFRVSVVMLY